MQEIRDKQRPHVSRPLSLLASGALLLAPAACHTSENDPGSIAPALRPSASAGTPLDHLAPGELAVGTSLAFGFPIPQQMHVDASFRDAVHASGQVAPDALARYVKEHVSVPHVEVAAGRIIFPSARIRGGAPDHVYQIEIVNTGPSTLLVLRDVTPPPIVQGLSETERWRRAGMTPDGKPLNPKLLK